MDAHQPNAAPSSQFTNEQIVDWLIDECRDAGSRIAAVTTSGDRIVAIGSTVIALSATVAIGGGKSHLLMWLPLSVSVVVVYMLYLNNMVRALIGYKVGLEAEVERRVGVAVIAWQSLISGHGRTSSHAKSLLALSAVVYLASIGLGLIQALRTLFPGAWGYERAWLYILLTSLTVAISLWIVIYLSLIQRGSKKAAMEWMAERFADTVDKAPLQRSSSHT